MNEGKIYHFEEMEEFFGGDEWKLQIDISDIWNKYFNKKITIEQFNKEYAQRLIKYKKQILELGNDIWNSLVPHINDLNTNKSINESFNIYDSIYDISDKNDILIKTK
ncbi:MAG: hypothetical protein ACOC3V_03885 [bacterium]